ncbi:MAG: T9SS type A sorting domain-containing protein [Bacteroidetes bacterium]|nr:T9SS type A sorting domain-containing protein [Bacteroidota bacterium]
MKKLLLIISVMVCVFANAQYTKLLDFTGLANGGRPHGSLISDGTFLYGMTQQGGASFFYGTIFKIKADGTGYFKLLDFANDTVHGIYPNGSLVSDGVSLYGMTSQGGIGNCSTGCGTIFKIKPDGTGYSKLLDFTGANGSQPDGDLIYDGAFLYGMTQVGGTNNFGTIFKIKPDGTGYSKLLDFTGANGSTPWGSLISDGTFLYGMTQVGGANNWGTIFKIKPDGTGDTTLLNFSGLANGSDPLGSLIFDGTFLYGMTKSGGTNNSGTIFKIKPDGTGYSKLLDFTGAANGDTPFGSLISDGTFLYGVTYIGGTNNFGTIFKIKPDGTGYSKLLDFTNDTVHGINPTGSLISDGTFLYGTTIQGGTNNNGTIFKLGIETGVTENNVEIDFTIFPNPFSSQTTLRIDNSFHNATLTVYNSFGQTVKQIKNISGQTVVLSRDNLASGLYFVRLTEENKTTHLDSGSRADSCAWTVSNL